VCIKLVTYKDCTERHCQQNTKYMFFPQIASLYIVCTSQQTAIISPDRTV